MFKKQITIFFLFLIIFHTFVLAQDIESNIGPVIRFTNIESRDNKLFIEGYTFEEEGLIKSIFYTAKNYSISLIPVEAADGKYDSKNETFAFSIPLPSDQRSDIISVFLMVFDDKNNGSSAIVDFCNRGDYTDYTLYLSKSALNLNFIDVDDIFRIYYTPNVEQIVITEVQKKMSSLKNLVDSYWGFKYTAKIHILLCNPIKDDKATFKYYRGLSECDILTFPVPVKTIDSVKNYNFVLDSWIPHELGDYSTRHYFKNEFAARWLSEGIGDLTSYLYLKTYHPEIAKEKVFRIRISMMEDKTDVKTVNLLDGKWGTEYYLCSLAFIVDIYKGHGLEVFKKLFNQLNSYPRNGVTGEDARHMFSQILEQDINPVLTDFSTDEAIKILENVEKK